MDLLNFAFTLQSKKMFDIIRVCFGIETSYFHSLKKGEIIKVFLKKKIKKKKN